MIITRAQQAFRLIPSDSSNINDSQIKWSQIKFIAIPTIQIT